MSTQTGIEKNEPGRGQIARQEFGAVQLAQQAETASEMMAAQAKALVEARFIVAMRKRRDWDEVREKLLKACERPGFAGSATEKVWGAAWYRKPVGSGVEGFSVRFAEECVRVMGNIDNQVHVLYEDERRRIIHVVVLDLESNASYPSTMIVEKTVERRYLKEGQEAISVRVNSKNERTYLVYATEDEVFAKQNSYISKAIRNGVMRLVPGEIQNECRQRILAIRGGDIAKDPDGARRKILDGFAKLNVPLSELKELVGHDIGTATPAELATLRDLWKALEDGKLAWVDVMADLRAEDGNSGDQQEKKAEEPKKGLAGLTERLEAANGKKPEPEPEPASEQAQPPKDEEPEPPKKPCIHPRIPPSVVERTPKGKTIVCPDCGEEFPGQGKAEKPRQRRLEE